MSFFKRLLPLKAHMTLSLQGMQVEQGEPFKGLATLEPKENFRAELVRLEVRVTEKWEEPTWTRDAQGNQRQVMSQKTDTRHSQDVPLSQPFDAVEGGSRQFPVEVTVPFFQPTRYGGVISYSLKAVADVKGRPDVTAEVTPTVLPLAPGVTKIIEKEVVKVPCKYCGTLVAITADISKCPSCGAPMSV
jgi:hypothetical protein